MTETGDLPTVIASAPDATLGYRSFTLGSFGFSRDEYFAHVRWTTRDGRPLSHTMDIGNYLRALMRDVAWGFFYGWVNFDHVVGTANHYKSVDLYAGSCNATMKEAGVDLLENFPTAQIAATFAQMLDDWTNEGFDPFAAPQETGTPYGRKRGHNRPAITRARELATRCVGLPGDLALRTDERGTPVNRAFADVAQDMPELHPEPGFEGEVHAFNLFAFLSRSQVTWNPSFTSVVKYSFMCPTTEEHILPIIHGNDRVEWFFQMCDEIHWDCADKDTGKPLARVIMKAGDMAAMPAYCRHQGYSPKRSMLLVWENGSPTLVYEIQKGDAPKVPVKF
ncbi:MAG: hydroxyquinol 1,2-dioxygenase [Ramlibacter sp.]